MTEVSEQSLDPAKGTDKALPVIAVDDLHKSYGRKRVKAVDGLSFRVEKGEIFGLLGPDGAGKTSVIQILAGVLSANRGAAQVAGINCLRAPERVKRLIGYMPQGLGLNLYDSLSVAENIEFFRQLRQVPASQFYENRDRLLDMTRLSPFLDRPAGKLSGGMRQKLALICTLVHLPDILLLDEPTTGVDPISRRDFWTIIHDLVAERAVTVLLTTSYMDEAERCHEVALMHAGREIASGEPEQLIAEMGAVNIALRCAEPERLLNLVRRWPEVENAALFGSEVRLMVTDPAFDLDAALHAADITDFTQRRNPAGLEEVFVHALRQPENGVGSGPDGTVPRTGLT
ncbi:MAG TPA: ABC transporter ATP-binding protein, partial [Alphaproteobacteria bacterium]|nr:ABC transporter ATP-binding protein [Alphaproteobacteria bacterium]